MKSWGYGEGYEYAHDADENVSAMDCLPERLAARRYYRPGAEGFERRLGERLEEIARTKASLRNEDR